MAIITKVIVREYEGGRKYANVYYKNGNPYRRDRVRIYDDIPKSAQAFMETAKNIEENEFSFYTTKTYTN